MIIKEITITNILGLKSGHLTFGKNSEAPRIVHVIQCDPTFPAKSSFVVAVQLIVSTKYNSLTSLTDLPEIQHGHVCIKFLIPKDTRNTSEPDFQDDNIPCTSAQALAREAARRAKITFDSLVAIRDLKYPEVIKYSLNEADELSCPVAEFQKLFTTNVDEYFPFLNNLYTEKSSNFFRFWLTAPCPMGDILNNSLAEYANINNMPAHLRDRDEDNLYMIAELAEICIFLNTECDIYNKLTVFQVSNNVRTVFEYITAEEYTVMFYIPYLGENVEITDISVEELSFEQLKTFIKLKRDRYDQKFLWIAAETAIKDLLHIALDIALAKYCKRKFIFIQLTDAIRKLQAVAMTCDAYLQKLSVIPDVNWQHKNYLQLIVDMCNEVKVTAIIEHTGGIPLPPRQANFIKGCINPDGECELRVVTDAEWTTLDEFFACLEPFFPQQ